MNCPRCHEELKENARFCSGCGLSFASLNTPTERGVSGPLPLTDPLIGRTLDGKYEITERIGAGGMGTVYRARRVALGDEVAVKVLSRFLVADAQAMERFRREAMAAAQLRHPNIITIHDFGEARGDDAPAYIVMELVEGASLRELLLREGKLRTERAVALMREICAGVGAAHRRGIFHRDLKPDNVIVVAPDDVDERETVKVLDFGIAKLRDMAGGTALTQTGAIVGSPHYMSPEQCKGEPLDARADVYSLGAMLYEMLTGERPFVSETPTGLIAKHLFEEPPALPTNAGFPPALAATVRRALSKDADERPRDALEFARELREAIKPPAVPAPTIAAKEGAGSAVKTEVLSAASTPPDIQLTAPSVPPTIAATPGPLPLKTTPERAPSIAPPISYAAGELRSKRNKVGTIVLIVVVALPIVLLALGMSGVFSGGDVNNTNVSSSNTTSLGQSNPSSGANVKTVRNSLGMEFVAVPAGSFMMGSENGVADEKPVHQVTIREGFYMGRYEVTQAQWQAVMGNNPSAFTPCDQCPVENVSWNDAQQFIKRLNAKNDGYSYRLPSEAEWEYACRAGTTGDYAGYLDAMAWYVENSGNKTHPVGQKQPNAWGLYDMHGNVWEWCEDWYHDSYNGAPTDGSAWLSGGEQKYRVLRGGSWVVSADGLRSAYRLSYTPDVRNNNLGFRLVAAART